MFAALLRLRRYILVTLALVMPVLGMAALGVVAHAAYQEENLIDNYTFLNYGSMNVTDIYNFLHNEGSYLSLHHTFKITCSDSYETSHYGTYCNTNQYPWTIIYEAAHVYGINPRVIMATMQKEESLITDPDPSSSQVNNAMGYACPDSGTCSRTGFYNQVDQGTWQLRLNYARASGDNDWVGSDYSPSDLSYACASKPSTDPYYYSTGLYPGRGITFSDDHDVSYASFTLANAATASLYCYTPHAYNNPDGINGLPAFGTKGQYYSGSYNFVTAYEAWWGSTHSNAIKVSLSSSNTTEGGGSAVLRFTLTSQPANGANVAIPVTISNSGEASFSSSSSVTSATVTISNGNWQHTGGTVTVYGRNDNIHDGDITYTVFSHAPSSSDPTYGSLSSHDTPDVNLVNIDNESDIPIVGDWNGDGRDTASVRRGILNLVNNGFDGHTDLAFNYGSSSYNDGYPTNAILVGDWNGDGRDTLGFKVGNHFYLNNGIDGHTDISFQYGDGSETPLVGDWNGDGRDTIALKVGNSYHINNGFDGHTDLAFNYGDGTETPLAGDWNGDGRDTVSLRVGHQYRINNSFDGHSDFAYNYGR